MEPRESRRNAGPNMDAPEDLRAGLSLQEGIDPPVGSLGFACMARVLLNGVALADTVELLGVLPAHALELR